MSSLKEVGAQGVVAQMLNEIRKEKRRMRCSSREDHEVLLALARQQDHERALERKKRRMLEEDKERRLTVVHMIEAAKAASALLKRRKLELKCRDGVGSESCDQAILIRRFRQGR